MKLKILLGMGVFAVIAAINGAIQKFGKLDVMTVGFVIFSIIFLVMLMVRARNE